MKIFLSLAINRSILLNLGRISSDLSRRLFDKFLEARYNWVKSQQPQEITYAINQGSQFLVIGIIGQGMLFVSDLVVLIVFFSHIVLAEFSLHNSCDCRISVSNLPILKKNQSCDH